MSLHKRYNLSPAVREASQKDNERFSHYTIYILAGIAGGLIICNIILSSTRYIRTLTCLNNDTQRFFRAPQPVCANIKSHLLYAPLFTRRHSKQMRIGPFGIGILPTRFQSLLLLGMIVMNVVFAAHGMEWDGDRTTLILHLRNRTGSLALMNMMPLVLIAGRNNPLISWTRIQFDTWNLIHRWLGRIVTALAIAHSVCELFYFDVRAKETQKPFLIAFSESMRKRFLLFGFVAWVAMMCIFLTAFTAFRHAFYETFLHLHIALVALVLAALWLHIDDLPPHRYVKIIIAIWAVERLIRLFTLVYRNIGRTRTQAIVETLPGDAMRVTLRLARPWIFQPGQHVFLTLPSVGLWTNHPFSLAWSEDSTTTSLGDPEKGLLPINTTQKPSISLIIRRRGGFTEKLYQKVSMSPTGRLISLPALVEGPYGGSNTHPLDSYGTIMLFAGGVGITHLLPFIRALLAGHARNTLAARRVLLIWVIRSPDQLEWIRPWLNSILAAMPNRSKDILRVVIFVTRPRSPTEIRSSSSPAASVQMFPGKPNVSALLQMQVGEQVGAMAVAVCGPGGLADDVRAAVRRWQVCRNVDLLEGSFGW